MSKPGEGFEVYEEHPEYAKQDVNEYIETMKKYYPKRFKDFKTVDELVNSTSEENKK